MELEYKFALPDLKTGQKIAGDTLLLPFLGFPSLIEMGSTYYDTADRMLNKIKAGLRYRFENGAGIVCLKFSSYEKDGLFEREEYECPASDILRGLAILPDFGAPRMLCEELLMKGVSPVAEVSFFRTAYEYYNDSLVFEFCVDDGFFALGGKNSPFCELEIELKAGDNTKLSLLVSELQKRYSLIPELKSKLQRALEYTNENME